MLSFQMALEERNFRILDILIDLTQKMVEGELIQLEKIGRIDVSEEDALRLATYKTACLFSGCARLGAVLGGLENEREEALAEYGRYPVGIFVGTALPITNLAEFIAQSKSAKDGLSIGLPGVGSVSHLYAQLLASKTGAKLTFVPYRGDAPARLDLLAGNIHGIASTPDFGLIADGKARLIGSTGTQRWPQTPNVPTFAEAGFPDLVGFIVWGFAAPAGTPDDVIKILNEATNRALKSDRVKRIMVDNAYFVTGGTPEALWSTFNQQIAEFGAVVRSGAVKFE